MQSSNLSCSLLIIFSLLLLLILDSSALIALESCPQHCGVIGIPYPFGIGEGCFLDQYYEIECKNISGEDVPFLRTSSTEVIMISLALVPYGYSDHGFWSYASIHIKFLITSGNEEEGSPLNLTGLENTQVPLLVYEFVSNGNLVEHIHNELGDETLATWEVRLRIAIEVAQGLSYLHSTASVPTYHRDIKSSNIMLDHNYRAKLADFGSSRSIAEDRTHLTTQVLGTAGYLDPEYYQSSQYTEKSDVYSFGVVLVELITGEKPVCLARSPENRTLATYFNRAMKENRLLEIIDARIRAVRPLAENKHSLRAAV